MFCPKCGTNVDDSYAFCFKCGFDFSTINNSKEIQKDNNDRISEKNESSDSKDNNMLAFDNFYGTQDQFDKIYYDLCYVKRDYQKLFSFEEYVGGKYSGHVYEYNYGCGVNTNYLVISSYSKEHGILKCICDDAINDGTVQTLADNLAFCLSINYFMDLFGWRIYNFFEFCYKYELDWDEYSKLQERYDEASTDNLKNRLKSKMEILEKNYGDAWGFEGSVIKRMNLLDLNHIQPQVTKLAEQYSNTLSELYIIILNNAIKYHNIDYLQELYPTELQKQQIAKVIENEIIDKFRNCTRNLYLTLQKENECRRICDNINEMSERLSGASLLKKGALTIGLAVLSGTLGIANGIREGYNLYETDSKITELRNQLDVNYGLYMDEIQKLDEDIRECCDKLREGLKTNITDKYLVSAINDIFKKLQAQGVQLLPLNKYLK